MQNVTVRLPTRLLAELEREARNQGVSRSEYIRNTLQSRGEHDATDRVRALERQLADCQRDRERLRNEKQVLVDAYEVNQETAAIVKRRKDRQDASLVERATWWVFGRRE
ncbi:ribbon-helix-helix protein, CopG family [Natronomonas sp. F2-12]|uniref:Ribbon-helix-helix protein, CopG family n=1 Tax=Natronomonas aquatica TaxID=2841590 RepID=A0A9R1CVC8_9EURY|nr:ribbon-helix-helix protein, CopG family [Natronomonas aquatica]MCQ4334622.1 ribbon-helix-helix protein, CopG family [Natronomonas aquatica]